MIARPSICISLFCCSYLIQCSCTQSCSSCFLLNRHGQDPAHLARRVGWHAQYLVAVCASFLNVFSADDQVLIGIILASVFLGFVYLLYSVILRCILYTEVCSPLQRMILTSVPPSP